MPEQIVCAGRAVDDRLQPTGDPCGRKLGSAARGIAVAAGWLLAPDGTATCPTCRTPPPEITALTRQVRRG